MKHTIYHTPQGSVNWLLLLLSIMVVYSVLAPLAPLSVAAQNRKPAPTDMLIEQTCLASARDAVNPTLCGCIQDIANIALSSAEQAIVHDFLLDPSKSETIRQSKQKQHRAFWQHYVAFSKLTARYCARL